MTEKPATYEDGIWTQWKKDGGKWVKCSWQDAQPIIESNREALIARPEFGRYRNDVTHIARVPKRELEKWALQDGVRLSSMSGVEMFEWAKKHLKDPDKSVWRTMPGNL